MIPRKSRCVVWSFLCLLLASLPGYAQTQVPTPRRINQSVDDNIRVTMLGSTHPAVKKSSDLGQVPASQPMKRMLLVLKPSQKQQDALAELHDGQQDKNSANYHKWLNPEQFAAQFGPSSEDLQTVLQWLERQGFSDVKVARGGQWVEFSGTVAEVNRGFRTSMHNYLFQGENHIGNASDISLPAALTPVVAGVLSLHNFLKRPMYTPPFTVVRDSSGQFVRSSGNTTGTDGNGNYRFFVGPTDFQKIYDSAPLIANGTDGRGVSIAVLGRTDVFLSDIQTFRQIFSLPSNDPNILINGPDPGNLYTDQVESSVDIEWAGAAAPRATINFVESASTDTTDGIDLSAAYAVDNVVSPIVTLSYGACEALMQASGNQFYNALWSQAAAEGITVLVSAGDYGAAQCDGNLQSVGAEPQGPALNGPSINGLASTPYNVAVGGTQFDENGMFSTYWSYDNSQGFGSALGYIPEQPWNESCDPTLPSVGTNCVYGQSYYSLIGGGGGPSNCSYSTTTPVQGGEEITCTGGYAKPSWQTGVGVPNDGVRDTPDVSLNASPDDDGYIFCFAGYCQATTANNQTTLQSFGVVGGTSVSTPALAGLMALVEQRNGQFQGQANYTLYNLAAREDLAACNSSNLVIPQQTNGCVFNDVTIGSNSVPGLPGYGTSTAEWSAGTGYDLASGLGSVNAANLASKWKTANFLSSITSLAIDRDSFGHRGQPVPIRIRVQGAGSQVPTGSVSLVTDRYGIVTGTFPLTGGEFSGQVNLPGGSYKLFAHYAGDGTFGSSTSAPVSVSVPAKDSATQFVLETFDYQGNPHPVTGPFTNGDNNAVYLSASVQGVSAAGIPTGSVAVLAGSTLVTTLPLNSDGKILVETGLNGLFSFPVGSYAFTVHYLGDNSFRQSTASPVNITVGKAQSVTYAAVAYANAYVAGQPILLNAAVYAAGKAPATGTMQFYDNGQPLGSVLPIAYNGVDGVNNPQVSYDTTLSVGNHTITASYSGDANYDSVAANSTNAGSYSITVKAATGAPVSVTISASPQNLVQNQNITFVVHVAPLTPAGPPPTGTVSVWSNAWYLSYVGAPLVNGVANMTFPVNAGTYQVFAQYQGDSNYAITNSQSINLTVARITPPATLTASSSFVPSGQQFSLNFGVVGLNEGGGSYLAPSGSVQFMDATNTGHPQRLGPAHPLQPGSPLSSVLSMRITLPPGIHVISAQYSGDSYFNPVVAGPVTVIVGGAPFIPDDAAATP